MKKDTRREKHMWTKEEIKKIINLWDDATVDELAEKMNVTRIQIQYMANTIRKTGYKLAKKHKKGYLHNLIKEVVAELK